MKVIGLTFDKNNKEIKRAKGKGAKGKGAKGEPTAADILENGADVDDITAAEPLPGDDAEE